jgi:hypothetical protein
MLGDVDTESEKQALPFGGHFKGQFKGSTRTHSQYACALPWFPVLILAFLLYHCYLVVLSPAGVCACVFTAHRFVPAGRVSPLACHCYTLIRAVTQSIMTVTLSYMLFLQAYCFKHNGGVVVIILQAGIANSQASCCGVHFGPCRACNRRCFHKDVRRCSCDAASHRTSSVAHS